jgi:hypothetical protein
MPDIPCINAATRGNAVLAAPGPVDDLGARHVLTCLLIPLIFPENYSQQGWPWARKPWLLR